MSTSLAMPTKDPTSNFTRMRAPLQQGNPDGFAQIDLTAYAAGDPAAAGQPHRAQHRRARRGPQRRLRVGRPRPQTRALVTIGIVIAAFVASLFFALLVARGIVVPLRRLTKAAADVREQLPRLVEQVAVPGEGPEITLAPIPVTSRDEVGQLAAAFNSVNSTTVQVAQEQAALRGSIAEMFVNVARRDQVLLNRQLSFIDSLERAEEDPSTLANLFRLDHLATRMRRNAESLLVLAGIDSGRRLRDAMPLSDVVRTASSEIEQYDRVELDLQVDPHMHGFNALGAAHMLAELLENATIFSEPETPVTVTTGVSGQFVVVRILDQGLGMSDAELEAANSKIVSTSASDSLGNQRLGLFVVGRIAQRLGADVRLLKAAHGTGTETIVRFPATLFVMTETNLYGNGAPAALAAPRNDPGLPQIEAPVVEEVDLAALTDGQTSLGLPHRRRRDDGSDEAVGPIPVTELAQSTGLPTPVEEDVRRGQPGPARGARRSHRRRDLRCRLRLEARDGRPPQGWSPEPQPRLDVRLGQAGGAGCRSGRRGRPGACPRRPCRSVLRLPRTHRGRDAPTPARTSSSPAWCPTTSERAQLPAQSNAVRAPWMSSGAHAAPVEPMVVPQLADDDDSWEAQEAENREAQNAASAAALVAAEEAAQADPRAGGGPRVGADARLGRRAGRGSGARPRPGRLPPWRRRPPGTPPPLRPSPPRSRPGRRPPPSPGLGGACRRDPRLGGAAEETPGWGAPVADAPVWDDSTAARDPRLGRLRRCGDPRLGGSRCRGSRLGRARRRRDPAWDAPIVAETPTWEAPAAAASALGPDGRRRRARLAGAGRRRGRPGRLTSRSATPAPEDGGRSSLLPPRRTGRARPDVHVLQRLLRLGCSRRRRPDAVPAVERTLDEARAWHTGAMPIVPEAAVAAAAPVEAPVERPSTSRPLPPTTPPGRCPPGSRRPGSRPSGPSSRPRLSPRSSRSSSPSPSLSSRSSTVSRSSASTSSPTPRTSPSRRPSTVASTSHPSPSLSRTEAPRGPPPCRRRRRRGRRSRPRTSRSRRRRRCSRRSRLLPRVEPEPAPQAPVYQEAPVAYAAPEAAAPVWAPTAPAPAAPAAQAPFAEVVQSPPQADDAKGRRKWGLFGRKKGDDGAPETSGPVPVQNAPAPVSQVAPVRTSAWTADSAAQQSPTGADSSQSWMASTTWSAPAAPAPAPHAPASLEPVSAGSWAPPEWAARPGSNPAPSSTVPQPALPPSVAPRVGTLDDEVAAMLALRSDIQEQALSELSQLSAYRPAASGGNAERLTKRVPTAVPATTVTEDEGKPVQRDADQLRSRLSSFQSGTSRGRRATEDPSGQNGVS